MATAGGDAGATAMPARRKREAALIQAFDTTFSALDARSAAVLWAGGYRRAIVGIDYADPGLTQANLQVAAAQGFELEAFAYLWLGGDVAARVQQSIALVQPLGVTRLWLDCEDNGQGASGLPDPVAWPPSWIVELIGQARAACGAFPFGLYSGAWWWVPATGDAHDFASDPWWVADYDGIPTLTSWGLDFGGIAQPLGKQYAGDVALATITVDLSVFGS